MSRGQYEQALENGLEAIRLNPDGGIAYLNVIDSYVALDRYTDATRLIDAAEARRVFSDWMHVYRFELAFAGGDQTAMARERLALAGRPTERDVLESDADAAAFRGRFTDARVIRSRIEPLFGAQGKLTLSARAAMFDAAVGLPFLMPDDPPPMPNIAPYRYAVGAALAGDVVSSKEEEPEGFSICLAMARSTA